jgi:CheY-like chemotaxis protein
MARGANPVRLALRPVAARHRANREQQVPLPEPRSCRIAIVDDHTSVQAALSSLLRSYGCRTVAFDSAESLLAAQALAQFDCIISDLQMPGMNGLELLDHLRRHGNQVPLLILTAYPDRLLRERAAMSGAAAFLTKPFAAHDLIVCLQRACGNA